MCAIETHVFIVWSLLCGYRCKLINAKDGNGFQGFSYSVLSENYGRVIVFTLEIMTNLALSLSRFTLDLGDTKTCVKIEKIGISSLLS